MPDTATIIVNVYDGTRQPLSSEVPWTARLIDGRSLSERKTYTRRNQRGPSKVFAVPFFDNFFDDYTVLVSPDGYQDAGWKPVHASARAPANIDLMVLPNGGKPHFAGATWQTLSQVRPAVAALVRNGCESPDAAAEKYQRILEVRDAPLACFLNIMTALADIRLPSGKSPLDYYWNIAWPPGDCNAEGWLDRLDQVFQPDRFFCYVDEAILPDVRVAAAQGAFATEPDPQAWGHVGATESYKQTQFDVSNVQLTFHGRDTATFTGASGAAIKCVKIEPDIDYYKDLLAHAFLEVVPNWIAHGKTDPSMAYCLRWMAARREHLPEFNPLFTVQA
jgi:hypothetical protein